MWSYGSSFIKTTLYQKTQNLIKLLCCCSLTKSCLTLCNLTDWSLPACSVLHYPLEFAQIHVHWINGTIEPPHPLLAPSPFALSLSSLRVFSNELVLRITWSKEWSFSVSISLSNECSELISFRMDWFDLLAAQGTLKSLLQNHSSKTSILQYELSLWSNSHIHTWLLEKL